MLNTEIVTHDYNHNEIWTKILARLKAELGEDICNSWFARVKIAKQEADTVYLTVPTRFLKNWLDTHYLETLIGHWSQEISNIGNVIIEVRDATRANKKTPAAAQNSTNNNVKATNEPKTAAERAQIAWATAQSSNGNNIIESSPLDSRYTFDNFVICSSNELGHAAALQLAKPAEQNVVAFNPFYIHSSVGLGKTHLLQAIAHESVNAKKLNVLYLTAEKFMYHFVTAITSKNALNFKEKLRSIDVLIVDDMQFLQGPVVKREFSHLLNTMLDAGRQVIVAADCPPSELENLDERTKSRFSGGLVAELGGFDRNARYEILKQRANYLSKQALFTLNDDVLEYVSTVVNSNGRDLEGALTRLIAHQQLTKSAISMDMIQKIIQDLVNVSTPRSVKIEEIQRLVAKHYNVPKTDLLSARRSRAIVRPRQVAMYLSKTLTLRSLPEIGRRFGGRDHTTVLHAVRKVEELRSEDSVFASEIDNLRRMLLE